MKNLTALRARLRRAGLKPAATLPTPAPKTPALPADWPGQAVVTPVGTYFLAEYHYASDRPHGKGILSDLLGISLPPDLLDLEMGTTPADLVFMDTETTGLSGGAGTLAFLVGTGSYTDEGFLVRQYFLTDPSGEAAMLEACLDEMEAGKALVTFNGRAFDVPILQTRSALRLRRLDALTRPAHFDLLIHSRRLWRNRLDSCSLHGLETDVLDFRRSTEDVPSGMIPYLYREYLQTNDPNLMAGVLYHNVQDILSLAVLAAEVAGRYRTSPAEFADPLDALAMAFIYRRIGRVELAEQSYRCALNAALETADRVRALKGLASLYKSGGFPERSVELWEAWHAADPEDPNPCVELAKFHEWRTHDVKSAMRWAKSAAKATQGKPAAFRRREVARAVAHRIRRLKRKQKKRGRKKTARTSRT
jgi:uncharacterized protein YprB with RNaseH-like and TPR domain